VSQAKAYVAITEAEAKAGDMAGANATATLIKDPYYQAMAYVAIATAPGKTRDAATVRDALERAAAAAAGVTDADGKARAYCTLIAAQAQTGDVAGAIARVGKEFADSGSRAEILARAAMEFHEPGK
jgi:hypothetical protein